MKYVKNIVGILILLMTISLEISAQQQKGYSIDGKIGGLLEGEKVTMRVFWGGEGFVDYTITDSAFVKLGEFHLTGYVQEGPRLYWLTFEKHNKWCTMMIDNNEQIIIRGSDINKSPQQLTNWLTIEGSPTNYAWNVTKHTHTIYREFVGLINNRIHKIKDSIGFAPLLIDDLIASKKLFEQALYWSILRDPEGEWKPAFKPIIPRMMHEINDFSGHPYFMMDVYNSLNEKEKNSYYGKILKENAALCVGKPFPEFILPTLEGKTLSSKGVITKSKITLVHFWASNSFDRVSLQQELQILYKKYQNKGLNIIGVSSDTSSIEWKVRVEAEQYPWYNVSDLKGKKGIVGTVYHEAGRRIPNTTNVLIDNNGNIIAWDVNGAELQWYLWKAFGE